MGEFFSQTLVKPATVADEMNDDLGCCAADAVRYTVWLAAY